MPVAVIESLDHEGLGVCHEDGKTIFVDGALTGELVEYSVYRKKPSYAKARLVRIIKPSALRSKPRCTYYGICGGCSFQHVDATAQAAVKQRVLEDALEHVGRVKPELIYSAIDGPAWAYRTRARLGVRLVPKKGGVLVGFHERSSSYIADMRSCEVLTQEVSALLMPLRELIAGLSIPDRIPQIELAVGEQALVLVFRNLEPLTVGDEARMAAFAAQHKVHVWLQPKGPDTIYPLAPPEGAPLFYRLPEYGLTMPFLPTDFTQVNTGINEQLIKRAMQLLAPQAGERIADLFCGLGNFSLPIARYGAYVIGVEGSEALVRRAGENAERNGLAALTEFHVANLFEATPDSMAALGHLDKLLIDPPRDGALEVVKAINEHNGPRRIVYVSCKPSTLARDAAILVNLKGYRLRGAGIGNMFPQTSHVESIALFEKQ